VNSILRNIRHTLICLLCVTLPLTSQASDPVGDFFKRLGNSIANPGKHQPPRRAASKSGSKRDKDSANEQGSPAPAPSASIAATPVPAIRAAAIAPVSGRRRDVPYAIPVPNKPGFVTSPYAPASGLVDVRGFPSGTEVSDPYTGKIFLTP
jgi:hypothetical protein